MGENARLRLTSSHQYDTFYGSSKATLSKVKLEVIEIPNEPNFYNQPLIGTFLPGWNLFSYISYWTSIATKISQSVSLDGTNTAKFQIGAFVDFFQGYVWDAVGCLGSGVLDAPVAKYISTYATHWYFGAHTGNVTTDAKTGQLMGRSYVRSNVTRLSEFASQSNAAGSDFVVSETNSLANHGTNGISDAAEAAIWFVDYVFQAASVGVSRLFFHEGIGFAYNLIQPVAVTAGPNATPNPLIQASYYGAIIANEAIGLAANTRVAELAVNASNTAAYGIWEGDRLARAVLLNFDVYLPTVNASRLTTTVDLQGYIQGSKVSVKRLSAPATNATQGLTWGGVSYETLDGKPNGTVTESWLSGPTIQMNASEVVLLSFK